MTGALRRNIRGTEKFSTYVTSKGKMMKKFLVASIVAALAASGPAFAQGAGGGGGGGGGPNSDASSPVSPSDPTVIRKNGAGANGASMGTTGADSAGTSMGTTSEGSSKNLPGSSNSNKPDSSLSTNGSAPKQ